MNLTKDIKKITIIIGRINEKWSLANVLTTFFFHQVTVKYRKKRLQQSLDQETIKC